MGKPLARGVAIATLLLSVLGGCVSTGVDSYEEFRSAVDSGANCSQLWEMRSNFSDRPSVQGKIDDDLDVIGCASRDSERTDQ